jgi:hypothetical protein
MTEGDSRPPSTVLQEARVAWATPQSEEIIPLKRREWRRIRQRVQRLKNPVENASNWAATFFGVAVAAAFSIIPLSSATEKPDPWVIPVYLVITGFSLLFAGFALWVHGKMKSRRGNDVEDICKDMDSIEELHPSRGG